MPPIKNWSRRRDLEGDVEKVWENRETGEIAWVSEKVPRDGYYFYVCPGEDDFRENRHTNSARYGFSHLKSGVMRQASGRLRDAPEGFAEDV